MRSEEFLPNGIGVGILADQMAVAVVEAELLAERSKVLLLRAFHDRERSEAIREKHCLYENH